MMRQAPGILVFYFMNAVLLTALVSAILLFWYRRAIARSMRTISGISASLNRLEEGGAEKAGTSAPLIEAASGTANRSAAKLRWRLVVVYGLGSFAAAAVLAGLILLPMGDEFSIRRFLIVCYDYA